MNAVVKRTIVKGLIDVRDWVDDRFPLMQFWNDHMGALLRAQKFQLLVLLRRFLTRSPCNPDRYGHLARHEL